MSEREQSLAATMWSVHGDIQNKSAQMRGAGLVELATFLDSVADKLKGALKGQAVMRLTDSEVPTT